MLAVLVAPISFAVENTDPPASASSESGGVIVDSSDTIETQVTDSSPGQLSRAWSDFVDWLLDITDLSALPTASPLMTTLHVALLLVGLALVVFGAHTYGWVFRKQRYGVLEAALIRVVGLVFVGIAFII